MELLQELLSIKDEIEIFNGIDTKLFEDLGNLKKIDKSLFSVFQKPKTYHRDEQGKRPVRSTLGEKSRIEEFSDANQNAAWMHLEDKDAIGLIMEYDGEQILAVLKISSSSIRDKDSYAFIIKPTFFEKILSKEEYNNEIGAIKRMGGGRHSWTKETEFSAATVVSGSETTTVGKIKKVIKLLFDAAKRNKKDLKTMIVFRDVERIKTGNERAKARSGSLPLPTGNKIAIGNGKYSDYENEAGKYFKELKLSLKQRLETYKASKAKAFDTPNELLQSLIKEGYFEKLKFMGFTYEIYNDRISFSGLRGEKTYGNSESYIEYKIQTGTPEYKNAEEEVRKIRLEISDKALKAESNEEKEAIQATYYEERRKILPPAELKVVLKLVGGVITPDKIVIGKDNAWIY